MGILFEYKEQDNNFAVHHSRGVHPQAEDFPMHAHRRHELFYFINGRGSYYVEGNEYPLTPGCIMIMQMGETHRPNIALDYPYERLAIHFTPDLLNQIDPRHMLGEAITSRPLGQKNQYRPEILNEDLVRACVNAISAGGRVPWYTDEWKHELVLAHLHTLLFEIRRCFNLPIEEKNEAENKNVVHQTISYINDHLTENFNLDMLADMAFINKSYLNDQFKRITGSTIWKYTTVKRLFLARQYINAGMPATEAATACGWDDYSAFYRKYKTQFGISPNKDKIKQ